MKRLLLLILVANLLIASQCFPGPEVFMQGGVIGYEVDVYIDFEDGSNGDTITPAILSNGTHIGSWVSPFTTTGTPSSLFTVSTSAQQSLHYAVKVGSNVYTDSGSTRGIRFNPNGVVDNICAKFTLEGGPYSTASFGGYYKTSNSGADPSSVVFGLISGGSDYVVTHYVSGGVHINTGESCSNIDGTTTGKIIINPNTSYYFTGLFSDTSESAPHQLWMFETDDWTLSGICTIPVGFASGGSTDTFVVGRCGDDATASSGVWDFDNLILSYSGVFPLVPGTIKVSTPHYSIDSGTYSESQSVSIVDLVPGSSILYCIDTDGTCNPSTSYSSPINISISGSHLRAKAEKAGWTTSNTKDASYTIVSDSAIFDNTGISSDSNDYIDSSNAAGRRFTIASEKNITRYKINLEDANHAGRVIAQLYTDSSGTIGSAITGTDVYKDNTLIPFGSFSVIEFNLTTPHALSPGTYWLVLKTENTGLFYFPYGSSSGITSSFRAAGGPISDYTLGIGVWGY